MEKQLQAMYDQANWSGYAKLGRTKQSAYNIRRFATWLGVELEYNCPA